MAFVRVNPGDPIQAQNLDQVIDALSGAATKGQPIALTALNDATNYAETIQNLESGNSRALLVLKSDGTQLIKADVTGVTLGAPLNLPTGCITSTYILDGTIATVDLANGAVHGLIVDAPVSSSFSTTTTSAWVETNVSGTGTFTNTGIVRIDFSINVQHSVSNAIVYIGWGLDGAIQQVMGFTTTGATAGFPQLRSGFYYAVPLSGSHRIAVMLQNMTAGTLSLRGEAPSHISAMEIRR